MDAVVMGRVIAPMTPAPCVTKGVLEAVAWTPHVMSVGRHP
jgi:hypothetical protein